MILKIAKDKSKLLIIQNKYQEIHIHQLQIHQKTLKLMGILEVIIKTVLIKKKLALFSKIQKWNKF
jgi:hypothetical protein